MKKTLLKIATIVMALVVLLSATSVKAATLSVDKTSMDKDEIVTVTVKTKEPVSSMEFKLTFDSEKYEYDVDSGVVTTLNRADARANGNVLIVSAYDSGDTVTDTISVKFKAKDYGANIPFSISGTEFIKSDDTELVETFDNNGVVNVTVEKVTPPEEPENPGNTEEPENPENPGNTEDPGNTENPGNSENPSNTEKPEDTKKPEDNKKPANEYIGDNGEKIEKLPQTGSVMLTIVVVSIIVLAITGIIVYKKMN